MSSPVLLQRLCKFFRSSQATIATDCGAALAKETASLGPGERGFRWDEVLPEMIEHVSEQLLARAAGEGWNVGGAISGEASAIHREAQRLLIQANTVRAFFMRYLNRFQAAQAGTDGFTASEMTETRQEAIDIFERLLTGAVAQWLGGLEGNPEGVPTDPARSNPATANAASPQRVEPESIESAALKELRDGIHGIGTLLGKMRASNPLGVEAAVSGVTRQLQRMTSLLETLGSPVPQPAEAASFHPVRFAPLAVRAFLESLAETFRPLAEHKGLRFAMANDPSLVTVETDAPKLQRAASLLLGNAVQYTSQGGVSLIARPSGADWHLTIEDTGAGIDPELLANFLTGEALGPDRVPHGISVARSLTYMLGGHLDVDSMLRRGSRFSICLPRERPGTKK